MNIENQMLLLDTLKKMDFNIKCMFNEIQQLKRDVKKLKNEK